MRSLIATCLAVVTLVGCKKGDGLVVVNVSASPPVVNVASLQVDMTIARSHSMHSITNLPDSTIDSDAALFAVDVSADRGSTLAIRLAALDSSSNPLASGSGSTNIVGGKQSTIDITLIGAALPGDLAVIPDLVGIPVCRFDDPNSKFDNCIVPQ